MLLFIAEKHRVAPGANSRCARTRVTMAALWWVALSTQRTHAAFAVRCARIDDRPGRQRLVRSRLAAGRYQKQTPFHTPRPHRDVPPHDRPRACRAEPTSELGLGLRLEPNQTTWPGRNGGPTRVRQRPEQLVEPVAREWERACATRSTCWQMQDCGISPCTNYAIALATFLASAIDLPVAAASAILDHEPEGSNPPHVRPQSRATITTKSTPRSQSAWPCRVERGDPDRV